MSDPKPQFSVCSEALSLQKKSLLDAINSPVDLKRLAVEQLPQLAQEIRQQIISTVSTTGGHLAPNLGVVELTIALHYVFDTPRDKIIWDVGHQAYTHKLLTGRKDVFHTLRQSGGLSGFPKRGESPYDAFDTGHSSTSISAALGMAVGKCLKKERRRVIAVIGDGSMTAGLAFEGLNNAGDLSKDLIVVLNDNEMSISPNVGALSSFLSRKLTKRAVVYARRQFENFLKMVPGIGDELMLWAKKSEESFKSFLTPGMLFEALKFNYLGPVQGHRFDHLIETFGNVKNLNGPVLVHVLTTKGKGYEPAECNPTCFHGLGCFDLETGEPKKTVSDIPTYTEVFGNTLIKLAREDHRIVAVSAAMPDGTGLVDFRLHYPDRFFDVGICEQHAVTFAAGIATEGFRPVVAIYSTFLQRAYDQVLHDVCIQNLPVIFALDRGGIVGEDGETHQGLFDLSYLRHLPNMILMAPKDEDELRHMLYTAVSHVGPIALRYPRGGGVGTPLSPVLKKIPLGQAEVLTEGDDLLILAVGASVYPALEAARGLEEQGFKATVVNARFIKPLDQAQILSLAARCGRVLTVEENVAAGGFGSAVLELLSDHGLHGIPVKRLGVGDLFVEHGSQKILRRKYGLDPQGILEGALNLLGHPNGKKNVIWGNFQNSEG
ncbi:1-deoxy-D-xylulose-5-phosphate synthase [Desulfobacca acetoxidans]|uniref:1-deoxy-D-xylulose-5-phosphate synthase n=1 Tax=Desulfobacca acetoxidans (strain ATCC 700848 / DSM 11109 / ASRB2) TaxID=880072 RepID=F2NGF7_DESAR|nr:1-deoxy-D-xylulose-5-phosphate synthase [Desulfobacca acetoxidans]AEB08570.1 1-deoxy-D-xylulose-5-phosphate synthase [Desulfobacca acetoxidans DSM 11109]